MANRQELAQCEDSWQQGVSRLAEKVSYSLGSGATRMSRKTLNREVLLAAILDVILGLALLTGTIYVAIGFILAVTFQSPAKLLITADAP
jgi:hypothetical protein